MMPKSRTVSTRLNSWVAVLLIIAAIISGMGINPEPARAIDEFDTLREKLSDMLTGSSSYDTNDSAIANKIVSITTSGQNAWNSMDKTSGRTYLWSDAASATESMHITASYSKIWSMALAYKTTGSALQGNSALLADTIDALDWMQANRYNSSRYNSSSNYGNWWDWEIGAPQRLVDIVAILYDQIDATRRTTWMNTVNYFVPKPDKLHGIISAETVGTGANRVWRANIVAVRGIIVKDSAKLIAAKDALSQVFEYVTDGDGFYRDGSFIQHTAQPYNGGYGVSLLSDLSNLVGLLSGSTWKVTDTKLSNIYDLVYNAYEPLIYKGAMMDMVRGREISRDYKQDHRAGAVAVMAIIRISQFAPTPYKEDFRSMVKYWIQADTVFNFYEAAPISMIIQAREIIANAASRGELVKHKQYPGMDKAVHLRPGFGFAVSMYSTRVMNYETIGGNENKRGWHTAEGMTYIYNSDLDQYTDYWPTIDSYKLPGTTAGRNTTQSNNQYQTKGWVGGVELESTYGISGMHINPVGKTLQANKSWFMMDDEIVALGAGISSTDGVQVDTVVENRKLNTAGTNALIVNGINQSTSLTAGNQMNTNTSWIHLAGTNSGADIGYYFPTTPTVSTLREARTDSWSNINSRRGSIAPITQNYMLIRFLHGENPTNASYQYVLLPGKTSSQVSAYAANPDIEVLSNTTDIQAVWDKKLGIVGANFWNHADSTVLVNNEPYLSSNKKSSVMVKESPTDAVIAVSDPTQLLNGEIEIELRRNGSLVLEKDSAITVTQLSPTIKLKVDVSGSHGRSFEAKIKLANIAYWKFDESSGSAAADSTGNGHQGTLVNAAFTSGGKLGNALSFNGTSSYVTAPDATDLDFTNKFKLDVWLRFAAGAGTVTQKIVEKQGSTLPYSVRVSNAGKIGLYWNGSWYESDAIAWNNNEWYHLVVTHNGSAIYFQLNGVNRGTVPNTEATFTNSGELFIGRGRAGTEAWFNGKMDELKLIVP